MPHVYSGKDKTFFFASYEALRLPRQTPIVISVPSVAMRSGNLTDYLAQQGVGSIYNYDGTQLDPSAVPVSPVAAAVMSRLTPLPNTGDPSSYQNNYATNFPAPISSNQGDLRVDHTITSKQSVFGRLSYKVRDVTSAPNPNCSGICTLAGSLLTGGYSQPETDIGLTAAYTYVITPSLINEFRTGLNLIRTGTAINSFSTQSILGDTGITGITDPDAVPEAPEMQITGFSITGGGNPSNQRSAIFQIIDNVTWTKQNHTIKLGFDFRRLTDHDDNVFGNYRSGLYDFNGTSTVGTTIGDLF